MMRNSGVSHQATAWLLVFRSQPMFIRSVLVDNYHQENQKEKVQWEGRWWWGGGGSGESQACGSPKERASATKNPSVAAITESIQAAVTHTRNICHVMYHSLVHAVTRESPCGVNIISNGVQCSFKSLPTVGESSLTVQEITHGSFTWVWTKSNNDRSLPTKFCM